LRDFGVGRRGIAILAIVNNLANVDHSVTDSLQFGDHLHRCGYEPKVSGDRLMQGEELQTHFFQVNVHLVHVAVLFDEHAGAANIMFAQASERALDLRDDQVSHLAELLSQFGKFEIKVLVRMFHG
jgi:hypothetical protein